MAEYIVRDPIGVYEDQKVKVPFRLRHSTLNRKLGMAEASAIVVRIMAIEAMYGCPISEVCPSHVCDVLQSVEISPQ